MKRNTKTYHGMTYHQLQAENRTKLNKKLDKLRKKHGLKNKGWGEIIALYQWLQGKKANGENISPAMQSLMDGLNQMLETEDEIRRIAARYPEINKPAKSNVIPFPMERVNHG